MLQGGGDAEGVVVEGVPGAGVDDGGAVSVWARDSCGTSRAGTAKASERGKGNNFGCSSTSCPMAGERSARVCWASSGFREGYAGLVEEGVDEGFAVEGEDVFEFFADAGVDDGEFELGGDGEDDAAFGGAVELGEDDAGDAGGFGEEAGLGEAVLAGCRVHDEEGLVGGAGDESLRGATHLVELLHEVGFGVEAAGGVDDEDLRAARLGGGAGVVEGG